MRHLGETDWAEVATLHSALVEWLKEHGVAGSIAQDYSLYRALEDEWVKAREALGHSGKALEIQT